MSVHSKMYLLKLVFEIAVYAHSSFCGKLYFKQSCGFKPGLTYEFQRSFGLELRPGSCNVTKFPGKTYLLECLDDY